MEPDQDRLFFSLGGRSSTVYSRPTGEGGHAAGAAKQKISPPGAGADARRDGGGFVRRSLAGKGGGNGQRDGHTCVKREAKAQAPRQVPAARASFGRNATTAASGRKNGRRWGWCNVHTERNIPQAVCYSKSVGRDRKKGIFLQLVADHDRAAQMNGDR